ncbi:MAG: hypothetical protein LBN00_03430 [Oscillospiraceae bacterium]|jgi:hypothetical protein|nr:hypothetical protein [Oscillospiraceae bacterium]
MNKKKLIAALSCVIVVAILAAIIIPSVSTAASSIRVYNPLGELVPQVNQPLAERVFDSFADKRVAFVYYAKALSPQSMRALENLLANEYSGTVFDEYNLGSSIGAKPLSYYETLAEYDAVVIGVADCTQSAWWGAYHAKMIEALGTPAVLLAHEAFADAFAVGALDNGFGGARGVVVDSAIYSRAATVLRNNGVEYLEEAFGDGVYAQIKSALTDKLTEDEKSPPAITPQQLAGWTDGDPTAKMLEIEEADEVRAAAKFNSMSMELGFGDGLPLIMPLPELVDDMLAATTRNRDDVLGRIMPRGGIMTVEKIAVNSVMAGARPEYFPAILAAMEAYASSWEDGGLLYHTLTSSDNYSLMLLFSGPIVEELGISGQWGYIGSGNEANNGIGRAVRLSARNIGVNRTNVTDGTARQGRQNDHALTVFGEEEKLLPAGWERHNEMLGFKREQSTVTLLGYYAQDMYFGLGGVNAEFVPLSVVRSGATKAGIANVSIMTIPRNVAALLQSGLGPGGTVIENKTALLTTLGYAGGNQSLLYPVVVGDPDSARVYTGGPSQYGMAATKFYGMQAFQSRLITGAAAGNYGKDTPPPAQPTKAEVYFKDGYAYLSWSAPSGGGTGLRYQVSYTGGAAGGTFNPAGILPDTGAPQPPAPPVAASSFTAPAELRTAFNVGIWPMAAGSYDPGLDGHGIQAGTLVYGLFNASYATIAPPAKVTGYNEVNSVTALTAGSWYLLRGSSGFDYVLIKPENPVAAPLIYTPKPFNAGAYDYFPAWIDVPAGVTNIVIPGVTEGGRYYSDFWVRAVDDGVVNAVGVAVPVALDYGASGRGAWTEAAVVKPGRSPSDFASVPAPPDITAKFGKGG